MGDRERGNVKAAARMRRYRQRQAEQAEQEADITRRRAARLADWVEGNCPAEVAWLIGHVPPEVAGDVVDETGRRDQARASVYLMTVFR